MENLKKLFHGIIGTIFYVNIENWEFINEILDQ